MQIADTTYVKPTADAQAKKLKKACADFEALFTQQMFKSMRASIPESDLIKKNSGEKMFTQMLDAEVAQQGSRMGDGGTGVADMLFDHLSQFIDGYDTGKNFPAEELRSAEQELQMLDMKRKSNGTDIAQ